MARRLVRTVGVLAVACLSFTISAQAAAPAAQVPGGGGFLAAGNYTLNGMRAGFNLFPADRSQTTINLFITREQSTSMPRFGSSSTSDITTLNLTVTTDFGFGTPTGGGCVLLDNPADFSISSDLQSASLHTTISSTTPTCFGAVSLPLPVTVDVTWTGSGPIQTTHGTSRFSCAGYGDHGQGTDTNNAASATFSITGLTAPVSAGQQLIGINQHTDHVEGAMPPGSCSNQLLGRGAGRPTPVAGNYHNTLGEADMFFVSPDSSTEVFLEVSQTANAARPLGGTSTSTNETDVSFFANGPTISAGGCLVLAPGDFTISSDLSMATLHTVITASTLGCIGSGNNVSPLPFSINASWVGSATISTTRNHSQFACLGYHFQNNGLEQLNAVANTTVAMTGLSPVTATGRFGTDDTRTHADGVAAPGCGFRG